MGLKRVPPAQNLLSITLKLKGKSPFPLTLSYLTQTEPANRFIGNTKDINNKNRRKKTKFFFVCNNLLTAYLFLYTFTPTFSSLPGIA